MKVSNLLTLIFQITKYEASEVPKVVVANEQYWTARQTY